MKKCVIIGSHKFDSVKEATSYIRFFLKEAPVNIYEGSNDFEFLFNLLSKHPNSNVKLKDVKSFEIVFKNSILIHYKSDRQKEDISWKICISNLSEKAEKVNITNSARYAVRDQISDFRNSCENMRCYICSEVICDISDVHIDHLYPGFSEIWDEYNSTLEEPPETVKMMGFWTRKFLRNEISSSFAEFHKTRANLCITHSLCNLKKGKPSSSASDTKLPQSEHISSQHLVIRASTGTDVGGTAGTLDGCVLAQVIPT